METALNPDVAKIEHLSGTLGQDYSYGGKMDMYGWQCAQR